MISPSCPTKTYCKCPVNKPIPASFIAELQTILAANQILTDATECWPYGYDNSRQHRAPDVVVFPQTHEQVEQIIRLCSQYQVPVVARGRGTGTTGAAVPLRGGLIVSTERMKTILSIDPDNRAATVQPGATNQEVQDALAVHGFFWPPDPTSAAYCTIGGNLAFNSSGPRAVKYGTPRDNVLGLKAITGEGNTIHTGTYTSKGVVGYDLTRLIIGSEGTLAFITEATLKLTPIAETKRTLQAIYQTIDGAAQAVAAIMAQPVTPSALEFIDGKAIDMIRSQSTAYLPPNAGAMLMIEVDGQSAGIDEASQQVQRAATNQALQQMVEAKTSEQIKALWATRKALSPALRKIAPKKINEDVVVPVSEIPTLLNGLDQLSEKHKVLIVNFGHAGNGNIHVNLLIDPDDPQQLSAAHACLDEVFSLVLSLRGTLSGEHGVGIEKRDFVDREIDPNTLTVMKNIKKLFDPQGILNPDKVFPLT